MIRPEGQSDLRPALGLAARQRCKEVDNLVENLGVEYGRLPILRGFDSKYSTIACPATQYVLGPEPRFVSR